MHPHPPKPRLTLRVGITGHRPDKLHGAAAARIQKQLPEIFAAIEAAAAAILRDGHDAYANAPPLIRLVSGFAEGADQMAVNACPPDWAVEAILPFPKDEYLLDFVKSAGDGRDVREEFKACLRRASTITELPFSRSQDRALGYADAGGFLLRQIDLLIAAWDGKAPKPGGTGAIAREAFDGGIPVVWLLTEEKHKSRHSTGNEPDFRPHLITEFSEDGVPSASDADCTKGPLGAVLAPIFAAPGKAESGAHAGLERFYAEEWQPVARLAAYDILKRWANKQRLRFVIRAIPFARMSKGWDEFLAEAPDTQALRQRIEEVLVPRFVWADALAVHFSHHYRSAYVLAYTLSAVAVFVALFGMFFESVEATAVLVLVELLMIIGSVTIVAHGRNRRWHERWLEYRALAESLRHGRYLAYVSEFGRIHDSTPPSQREPSWVLFYIRATMREVGVPGAKLDATYQWQILNATLRDEIEKQVDYHKSNSEAAHRIDHRLHRLGNYCFFVTIAMLGVFLLGYLADVVFDRATSHGPVAAWLDHALHAFKPWMILAAAGLPALGAAVSGIRVTGDFEGSERHSHRMLHELAALTEDYMAATSRDAGLNATSELLIATARSMSEDLAAWQELYGRKRLTLPA